MKTTMRVFYCIMAFVAIAGTAYAAPWSVCGQIDDINPATCTIPGRPLRLYEYAIAYNTTEPVPVVCTFWNVGTRIANKTPYFIDSDNPPLGMKYGGFVFYKNTAAPDDNVCGAGYKHQYWFLTTNNAVNASTFSNGCYSSELPIYCRLR
jgi:hypothetical protein